MSEATGGDRYVEDLPGQVSGGFSPDPSNWIQIDLSGPRVINPPPPAEISKPIEVRGDEQIPFFDEVRW